MDQGAGGGRATAPDVDMQRPSDARVYDLLLGGKDNFEVDRQLAQQVIEVAPELPALVRANRRWLAEVVERLLREAAVLQFLDLGSGLPTADNTHEIAARVSSAATVVYLDKDPTVIRHGQALLADDRHSFFAAGDLTDPATVLADPVVTGALDLGRPVAVLQCLVLHHVRDTKQARAIVDGYLDALPSGSYLALTHPCNPRDGSRRAEYATGVEEKLRGGFRAVTFRTPDEIASLFEGLELLEPGLVGLDEWWERPEADPFEASNLIVAGLARKP
ncbi:SAM-dependent methyltransferase [Kribbella sp. CA-293567]|uniref:SAM-dependent methyltransferase n=1 Tax=Kribbella sp. CA-293567 TaxID=3002436 RepID=UPI0022DD2ABB|nr:SAM-dependent methyltransferase [Kribbella sp. CA-293567]WBQ06686.1 SAM-dependent methyltransferase [Kribbella sp. CA-293567]